jgi:hypothetical protein
MGELTSGGDPFTRDFYSRADTFSSKGKTEIDRNRREMDRSTWAIHERHMSQQLHVTALKPWYVARRVVLFGTPVRLVAPGPANPLPIYRPELGTTSRSGPTLAQQMPCSF